MLPRKPVRVLVMAIWLVFLLGSTHLFGARVALSQVAESPSKTPVIPCPPRPIPPPPGCESKKESVALLRLRLRSDPNGSVTPGQTVAYWLEAQNSGSRGARDVRITLSFAAELQEVLGVVFTKTDAWVSDRRAGSLEMRMATIGSGETVTATLKLRTTANAPLGAVLVARAQMSWEGQRKEPALSNKQALTIARIASAKSTVQIEDSPPDEATDRTVALSYDGFASHEAIGLWYNRPNGDVSSLGQMRADAGGNLSYKIDTAALDSGRYELVAQGQYSRVIVVKVFGVAKATPPSKEQPGKD